MDTGTGRIITSEEYNSLSKEEQKNFVSVSKEQLKLLSVRKNFENKIKHTKKVIKKRRNKNKSRNLNRRKRK